MSNSDDEEEVEISEDAEEEEAENESDGSQEEERSEGGDDEEEKSESEPGDVEEDGQSEEGEEQDEDDVEGQTEPVQGFLGESTAGGTTPTSPQVQAAAVVKQLPDGLPLPTSGDKVGYREDKFLEGSDDDVLWTRDMGDCCAVATYDHESGERTLYHLPGSNARAGYYDGLSKRLSDKVTVIIASGTQFESQIRFEESAACTENEPELSAAMKKAGKKTPKYKYFWTHYERQDKPAGMIMGSFGITSKGKYGRVKSN